MRKSEGLDSLVKHLPEAPDEELREVGYKGFAASFSRVSLHLATDRGLLAIPLEDIVKVTPLSQKEPRLVEVRVAQKEAVSFLARANREAVAEIRKRLPFRQEVAGVTASLSPELRAPGLDPADAGAYTNTVSDGSSDDSLDWIPGDVAIVPACW